MKKTIVLTALAVIFSHPIGAQDFTATEVLRKSDAVMNAPQDQELELNLILVDMDGDRKERRASMLQKGSEKRRIKFLSPADQKGIAFLDLPGDRMYLYLPAFRKVRRIAGHIKNQKFAGTDLTYNDLATTNYADEYDATFADKTETNFVLDLVPKNGVEKDHSRLRAWVRVDNFYTEKTEYYGHDNSLQKTSERRKIEKVGTYWIAREFEVHDVKEDHRTIIILEKVNFDTGLSDKLFTERNLKR